MRLLIAIAALLAACRDKGNVYSVFGTPALFCCEPSGTDNEWTCQTRDGRIFTFVRPANLVRYGITCRVDESLATRGTNE